MMTTNKLTKTFASGSLAIGVLAGSVFTATSASAAVISKTWDQFKEVGGFLELGDKKVEYVSNINDVNIRSTDTIEFMEMGGVYQVTLIPDKNIAAFNFNAALSYKITITDPNFHFAGIQLDSDVSPDPWKIEKTVAEIPSLLLTSIDGGSDPSGSFFDIQSGGYTSLTVTDTIMPGTPGASGSYLNFLSNKFTQGTKVPEPGTILGLLAVGGLGLVSRFGKQK
jgi:hypothetical protein